MYQNFSNEKTSLFLLNLFFVHLKKGQTNNHFYKPYIILFMFWSKHKTVTK